MQPLPSESLYSNRGAKRTMFLNCIAGICEDSGSVKEQGISTLGDILEDLVLNTTFWYQTYHFARLEI